MTRSTKVLLAPMWAILVGGILLAAMMARAAPVFAPGNAVVQPWHVAAPAPAAGLAGNPSSSAAPPPAISVSQQAAPASQGVSPAPTIVDPDTKAGAGCVVPLHGIVAPACEPAK